MQQDNILLISDRTPIFPDLAGLLAQAGYRVTLTFYGQEAFQALRTGEFPLVISRFNKDWVDTRPFLDAVREPGREITLLILTPAPELGAPSEAHLLKTDGYQFTSGDWGGLRHLVIACLSKKTLTVGPAGELKGMPPGLPKNQPERTGSLLEFRRKRYAPGQHLNNQ